MNSRSFSLLAAAVFLIVLSGDFPVHAGQDGTIGGLGPEAAMVAGERMYREGLLPNGDPMEAIVQEDIPVDGTMFTCQSCHLQSGLGTDEGTIITLPTNGTKLYRTLHRGAEIDVTPSREKLAKPFQSLDIRPPYTDETLAKAIWTGITSSGREMSWTMPRYLLDPKDMDILVYYLKNLSSEHSPGLTAESLKFATVITDDVPEQLQQTMLLPLQAYIRDHNSNSRHEGRRAKHGPFYKQDRYTAYRDFELKIWRLSGEPATWNAQLQNHYDQDPVFALLGGISTYDWAPIERFCEAEKIPCLLPVTNRPGLGESNWYTLYFSKGAGQEGDAAARYLRSTAQDFKEVLQVVAGLPEQQLTARTFAETWSSFGNSPPQSLRFPEDPAQHMQFWKDLSQAANGKLLVIWVPGNQLHDLDFLLQNGNAPEVIVVSHPLVKNDLEYFSPALQEQLYLTYPYRLPENFKHQQQFVRKWLQIRKIPVTDIAIQSQMYFLGWLLTGVTRMMGDDFYRDYLLDIVDMMNDETYAVANFPRVSFGPGQRFASKGCFVVKLGPPENPGIVPVTPWVIH